jgi:hypothetical protein
MRRARIEMLEKRAMFSVNPFVDASAVMDAKSAIVEASPADDAGVESVSGDLAAIKGAVVNINFIFETVFTTKIDFQLDGGGLANTLAGDFNGDSRDDVASVTGGQTIEISLGMRVLSSTESFGAPYTYPELQRTETVDKNETLAVGAWGMANPGNEHARSTTSLASDGTRGPVSPMIGEGLGAMRGGLLLPYIEQDNLYKSYDFNPITEVVDGTSNTMMLVFFDSATPTAKYGPAANGIIAVLIGLAVDPSDPSGNTAGLDLQGAVVDASPIDSMSSTTSLDIWEHANLVQPGATSNGIIAILIGLTADPSDPSGNAVHAASFLFEDGSVRLVGMEVGGTANLLASDEFFSRLAGARLDEESLMATTYGRGAAASQLTHDIEFESWANGPGRTAFFQQVEWEYLRAGKNESPDWAPGYLQIELENTMISGFRDDDAGQPAGYFADLLISSFRDAGRDDQIEPGTRVVGSDHAWGNQVNSILHEDNEFYFPRMITAK